MTDILSTNPNLAASMDILKWERLIIFGKTSTVIKKSPYSYDIFRRKKGYPEAKLRLVLIKKKIN
jgi:hypothetical protein